MTLKAASVTYTWMLADVTHTKSPRGTYMGPAQDSSVPMFLGSSPSHPEVGETFELGGRTTGRVRRYEALAVLEVGHFQNPFPVSLVYGVRL